MHQSHVCLYFKVIQSSSSPAKKNWPKSCHNFVKDLYIGCNNEFHTYVTYQHSLGYVVHQQQLVKNDHIFTETLVCLGTYVTCWSSTNTGRKIDDRKSGETWSWFQTEDGKELPWKGNMHNKQFFMKGEVQRCQEISVSVSQVRFLYRDFHSSCT